MKSKVLSSALLLLIVAIMAVSGCTFTQELQANAEEVYKRPCYGDANHDKKIDMLDVVTVQKHLADLNDFTICRTCANVNGDILTLEDVVCIQKYIANLKSESECGKEAPDFALFTPRMLDEATKTKIIEAFMAANPITDSRKDYIMKNCDKLDGEFAYCDLFDILSDGTLIVWARYYDESFPAIIPNYKIGNYRCHTDHVYLLMDNRYISILDAYNQGLLSEKIFDELIFKLHLTKE